MKFINIELPIFSLKVTRCKKVFLILFFSIFLQIVLRARMIYDDLPSDNIDELDYFLFGKSFEERTKKKQRERKIKNIMEMKE